MDDVEPQKLPSRYQLGDEVRVRGKYGVVSGVCFRAGSVSYEVGGVFFKSHEITNPLRLVGADG